MVAFYGTFGKLPKFCPVCVEENGTECFGFQEQLYGFEYKKLKSMTSHLARVQVLM